jgi:hypothetical protein
MPGIPLFNTDPQTQANAALIQQRMALANALMQQGLTPIDTSNRQVGGVAYHVSPFEGLAKIAQSYYGQKGLKDSINAEAQLASNAYANLLQKYQPGQSPSYSPDQTSDASQAALSGGGGPTNANASKMAQLLGSQQPANGGVNPYNPAGMPAPLMADYAAGFIPKEAFDIQASRYNATDATKAATQGGMDVGQANQQAFQFSNTDPKVRALRQAGFSDDQIKAALMGEAAKAAEIERRGGNEFVNPFLGASGIAPKIPENANPVGPVAPNGAIPGGVSQMPGSLGVTLGNSQAGSTGSANGSIIPVTLSNGANVPMRGAAAVGVRAQPMPQAPAANSLSAPSAGAPAAAIGGGVITAAATNAGLPSDTGTLNRVVQKINQGMSPTQAAQAVKQEGAIQRPRIGQSTSDAAIQKSGADVISQAPQQGQQARMSINGLESALRMLDSVPATGPGTLRTNDVLAMFNNAGIPIKSDGVNNYQAVSKFLANSLNQAAAGTGSSGSDARFESFSHGQPNANTMNKDALAGAIRYVLSQQDAAAARADFLQKAYSDASSRGDPNAALTAQNAWTQAYKPEFFAFNRMSPQEQQRFLAAKGQGAANWVKSYNNYAQQTGWVR